MAVRLAHAGWPQDGEIFRDLVVVAAKLTVTEPRSEVDQRHAQRRDGQELQAPAVLKMRGWTPPWRQIASIATQKYGFQSPWLRRPSRSWSALPIPSVVALSTDERLFRELRPRSPQPIKAQNGGTTGTRSGFSRHGESLIN
jgi:hypothetical protein